MLQQPEYQEFDTAVRKPGKRYLRRNPRPSAREFSRHSYWKKAAGELHEAYSGCCAYTSMYMGETGTVDHFLPKSKFPLLAYEWKNYRLSRPKINHRKGDVEDLIDPFRVKTGWFELDLPSCLVRAGRGLSGELRRRVISTIDTLQLNADDRMVQERCDLLVHLAVGDITLGFLERRYPFLAVEVKRQRVVGRLSAIFRVP